MCDGYESFCLSACFGNCFVSVSPMFFVKSVCVFVIYEKRLWISLENNFFCIRTPFYLRQSVRFRDFKAWCYVRLNYFVKFFLFLDFVLSRWFVMGKLGYFLVCPTKICLFCEMFVILQPEMERWQSGRMRRSWKPLTCEGPGVRIPLFPLGVRKGLSISVDSLFFGAYWMSERLSDENKVNGWPRQHFRCKRN